MIVLKSKAEIEILRKANAIVVEVMARMEELLAPGITSLDLNRIADEYIRSRGAKPSFVGYLGYQHALCTSVNNVVVHGVPNKTPLVEGDIIGIDCGVYYEGFHGDHARTFFVGTNPPERVTRLFRVSEEALARGIAAAQPGGRLYDISAAVQQHAEAHGYSIVRDYVGHGVGRSLHEEPQVPNFGTAGTGIRLRPGLVLAIEPMVNEGTADVRLMDDEWTVVTADGKLSTHFEHSVAITEDGPDILSRI